MKSADLNRDNYNSYYQQYIDAVGNAELLPMMEKQFGKWTTAMTLQHIIDTERVFQYRALRFSRNDKTHLPGFDQDTFVAEVNVSNKSKETFIEEYKATRAGTIALFKSLNEETIKRFGIASNSPSSVESLGFIICGHQRHHRNIIRERYL